MFGRWKNGRLTAAENALRDGQIDDAYERIRVLDATKEPRVAELCDELGRGLAARARLHAQAGRYQDALIDLDRLADLQREDEDSRALRKRVQAELAARVGRHAERADAAARAARHVQEGDLETARIRVDNIEHAGDREQLKEELDVRAQRANQLLKQSREALAAGDLLRACRVWEDACTRHGRTRESESLGAELARALHSELKSCFQRGRLDRLHTILAATHALRAFDARLQEFEQTPSLLRRVGSRFTAGDWPGLRDALLRLRAIDPDAKWLDEALKNLNQMSTARDALLASPIGLLSESLYAGSDMTAAAAQEQTRAAAPPTPPAQHDDLLGAKPLLLLIDGTCSCLLLSKMTVRIGRVGAPDVDIPIPADIHAKHAEIVRGGGDYFLVAHAPVEINGRSVKKQLLRNGDRITLGASAKLTFVKPSAKSETAVLRMGSRARLPQDVDRVVLFSDTCVIGPQSTAHIHTREGETRAVLFAREQALVLRLADADGRPRGRTMSVPQNRTVDYGDLRMTVKEYELPGSGRLA